MYASRHDLSASRLREVLTASASAKPAGSSVRLHGQEFATLRFDQEFATPDRCPGCGAGEGAYGWRLISLEAHTIDKPRFGAWLRC
jgi:hypothetical protein